MKVLLTTHSVCIVQRIPEKILAARGVEINYFLSQSQKKIVLNVVQSYYF